MLLKPQNRRKTAHFIATCGRAYRGSSVCRATAGAGETLRYSGLLLPTGSEERELFGFGSIGVAIIPSLQNMKIITVQLHDMNIVG